MSNESKQMMVVVTPITMRKTRKTTTAAAAAAAAIKPNKSPKTTIDSIDSIKTMTNRKKKIKVDDKSDKKIAIYIQSRKLLIDKEVKERLVVENNAAITTLQQNILINIEKQIALDHNLRVISLIGCRRLLRAWSKMAILVDAHILFRMFSTAELLLLGWLIATVAHILAGSSPKLQTGTPPKIKNSFLFDYEIADRLCQLNAVEIFYTCIMVAKQILDVDEDLVYKKSMGKTNYSLLVTLLNEESGIRDLCATHGLSRLQKAQWGHVTNAILSLYLFTADLKHPFAGGEVHEQSDIDSKIQFYLEKQLDAKMTDYHYLKNPGLEKFFVV